MKNLKSLEAASIFGDTVATWALSFSKAHASGLSGCVSACAYAGCMATCHTDLAAVLLAASSRSSPRGLRWNPGQNPASAPLLDFAEVPLPFCARPRWTVLVPASCSTHVPSLARRTAAAARAAQLKRPEPILRASCLHTDPSVIFNLKKGTS